MQASEPPVQQSLPVLAIQANTLVTLDDCRRHASWFGQLVSDAAGRKGVEPRALAVRTLLHLPRVAGSGGQLTLRQIRAELGRCTEELLADQARLGRRVPEGVFKLGHLRLAAGYSPDDAKEIFTHLHYLRSARSGSINYALVDPVYGRPISLCSVSPMEWRLVGRQLTKQFGVPMDAVWEITRVYSFDVSPPNAISYLLAKVRGDIRRRMPSVRLLSTAVDPNLGFTGVSYLAANWQRWMTVKARPYMYYRGSYVTPRQLRADFGTADFAQLQTVHGTEFELSKAVLLDPMIFCCRVRGETEFVPEDQQRRLRR